MDGENGNVKKMGAEAGTVEQQKANRVTSRLGLEEGAKTGTRKEKAQEDGKDVER